MKKAVILDGTLRSLPYIKEYIKDFYGNNTDYFLNLWDFEFNFFTIEEVKNLSCKYKNKFKLKGSEDLYQEVNKKLAYECADFLNAKIFNWKTKEGCLDYFKNDTFYNVGQVYSKHTIRQLISDPFEYDSIIIQNPDRVPYGSVEHFNKKKSILSTPWFTFKDGMIEFEFGLFSLSSTGFLDYFNNIVGRYKRQQELDFFFGKTFFNHNLHGMLLLNTNIILKNSKLEFEIVRKDAILNKIPLFDRVKLAKIRDLYGKALR